MSPIIRGHRVLLAEDNELNSEIAKTLLEASGFSVEAVWDGQEAVDAFVNQPEGYYDLVLMDIQMPIMIGTEAAKEIRASSKNDAKSIPIIAMSANAFDDDVVFSLKSGMNEHITKPIDIKALLEILKQYL